MSGGCWGDGETAFIRLLMTDWMRSFPTRCLSGISIPLQAAAIFLLLICCCVLQIKEVKGHLEYKMSQF